MHLLPLERHVLSRFVEGEDARFEILRQQLGACRVVSRKLTGVGFFTRLAVDSGAPRVQTAVKVVRLGDVAAEINGLQHGAGFVLVVKDGALEELEGFSYDEPWPEVVDDFSVFYWRIREDLAELI